MSATRILSPLGPSNGPRQRIAPVVRTDRERVKGKGLIDVLNQSNDKENVVDAAAKDWVAVPAKSAGGAEKTVVVVDVVKPRDQREDASEIANPRNEVAEDPPSVASDEDAVSSLDDAVVSGESGDQVLRLFASKDVPFLDFGAVEIGGTKTVRFEVLNDSFARQRLQLDRMPTDKGFSLTAVEDASSSTATTAPRFMQDATDWEKDDDADDYDGTYVVLPQQGVEIGITWTPSALGTARELIHFKVKSNGRRLQCIVFGRVVQKREEDEAEGARGAIAAEQTKRRFFNGLSGSRRTLTLTATKKPRTEESVEKKVSRGRPGFTAFHTDLWMQKQERAFTAWLNMVFLTQITCRNNSMMNEWSSCQFDAKVQNKLWDYYANDANLKRVMMNVEKLIDSAKLALKETGDTLFTDIRIQKHAVNTIMSYNPFWLRQGLQVILGAEMPEEESYNDATLREIVTTYLIEDQQAARRFATTINRLSAREGLFKPGYLKSRAQEFLKKFLLMVKLLDQLMMEEDAYDMPLLFRPKSKVKSSAAAVTSVLGESLRGEGNLLRRLKFHGFVLSYEQAPLLEFDFKVENLAVDLRDGVRLSKLVDYMNDKREDLISKTKIPSKARAVRIANTEKAFASIKRLGVSLSGVLSRFGLLDLKPKDIVEGNQELTLQLLWRVMRDWQIPRLVKAASLQVEIDRIKGGRSFDASFFSRDESAAQYVGDRTIELLLKWAQTICAGHGVKIENFKSSFADGYALCLIINHYVPSLLRLNSVHRVTYSDTSARRSAKEEEEAERVKKNFAIMHETMSRLGGLPKMLSCSDFGSHGPDEIAVVSFLAFLASRLMQLSREDRSAIVIQRKWKEAKEAPLTPIENFRLWMRSASVVQRQWRLYLERKHASADWMMKVTAACRIQKAYRNMTAVREARRLMAQKLSGVVRLQSQWRMRSARAKHILLRESALRIQANFRAWGARKHFREAYLIPQILSSCIERKRCLENQRLNERKTQSAVKIQAHFRMMHQRTHRLRSMKAILLLQKNIRGMLARQYIGSLHKAATVIQSTFKGYAARKHYHHAHAAATKIQASFRMHLQVAQYKTDMSNVVKAQSMARTWFVQRSIAQQRVAAVMIQTRFRSYAAKQLLGRHKAALSIQKAFKSYTIRKHYHHAHAAATKIQASFRMHLQVALYKTGMSNVVKAQSMARTWFVQRSIAQQRVAAVMIQTHFRGASARSNYLDALKKVVVVQKFFRAHKCRKRYRRYLKMKKAMEEFARAAKLFTVKSAAAIKIQAKYRGYLCRRQFCDTVSRVKAATTIQSLWRRRVQQRSYKNVLDARAVLRKWLPFLIDRTHYLRMKKSAVLVQSAYREHLSRRVEATLILQNHARRIIAKSTAKRRRFSIVKIQSHLRSLGVRYGCSKEVKSIRVRLSDATARVKANPKLSIGYQTQAALDGLTRARSIQTAVSLCKVLEFSTLYSGECRVVACDHTRALSTLLRLVRSCNRSEPHVDFLKHVMATLRNMADRGGASSGQGEEGMCGKLARVPEIFTALSEVLQMFRGNQEIFLPTARVMHALVSALGPMSNSADPSEPQHISKELQGAKKKVEGISQILRQKLRLERKYIDHMENKKGSDVSARESAKKVVLYTRDLQSLYDILNSLGQEGEELLTVDGPRAAKNTIVRKAFLETTNRIERA